MKTKHPGKIIMFGVVTSNGDGVLPIISLHDFGLKTEAYISTLCKTGIPKSRGLLLDNPMSEKMCLRLNTQGGEPSVRCEKTS